MLKIGTRALLIAVLLITAIAPAALAAPPAQDPTPAAEDEPIFGSDSDDAAHPLGAKQRALKSNALEAQVNGLVTGQTAEVGEGQFVEMAVVDQDLIFTVLGEFGDQIHPSYGGTPGPLHNQIPEPDRTVDNTTIWAPDFNQAYFQNLISGDGLSMKTYYLEQSSGLYQVVGDVSDWGQVPYNEARYGTNACGSIVCSTVWHFVGHSLESWYNAEIASGKTPAEIDAYLSQFDVWDRYDHDGDGNFDEPDGYIDHFQSVHAGEGEETGGGAQGSDAIWSHRWYAWYNFIGVNGPAFNPQGGVKLGGVRQADGSWVGGSSYWVGDYTIEPENGGVGVFVHEFGHDLDLPDLYDTAGNTCGAACENSTGFWTVMSSGSYGNDGTVDLGTKPVHMGIWEKFQLGWLNYAVAFAGEKLQLRLGPAWTHTPNPQGLFVVLPDKEVELDLGDPYDGDTFFYSGSGDNLDSFMHQEITLPAGAMLSAQARYQIELDWDYAYVVVSTDGGATWTTVETNLSTTTDPNTQNFGYGITGSSGGNWVVLNADLSAWGGQTVLVGFRYWTDGAVVEPGFQVDAIDIGGTRYDAGWTFDGFRETTGLESQLFFNAYVVEYRIYRGYDDSLRTGPYNFGFLDDPALQNWVERFPYQDGVLISYWDNSQSDNNTSAHPGMGLILPIDAHPATMYRADGQPWRARIQSYDSTFGLQATDALTLHFNSAPSVHPSLPAVSIFNDLNQYYNLETPTAGVINPHTGTVIEVVSVPKKGGDFVYLRVSAAH